MHHLAGVFAANVTPFHADTLAVDFDWLRGHLAYLQARGADGVVPLGTNGEGPALSLNERKAVIDAVMGAAGSLTVIPGVGCANLPETIELTRHAFAAGAASVLVLPPFFFKNVSDRGVLAYYRRLCDAALQPGQAILLYHFPRLSGVPITDEIVEGLRASHPGCLAGLKDSGGDLPHILHWNALFPELRVFAGSDSLAGRAVAGGCAGVITAAGNLIPDLLQAVRRAVLAGDEPAAAAAQARVNTVRGWLEQASSMHAATKFLLSLFAGLPPTAVRPPLVDLDPAEQAELARQAAAFLADDHDRHRAAGS